jgi:hypothetical protein
VTPLLSKGEEYAFEYFQKSQQPPLAPSLNAKLFQLFLNGKNCEEIRRLNKDLTLGQIVWARIEGDWDQRRSDHLNSLLTETSLRVQQATLETADFVCDLLAVANREHGDRLRRYLQTGDQKELGDFKIDSIFNLKQTIEVLQKLTGQDRQQTVQHKGEVMHTAVPIPAANKAPSPVEAANVLKLLLPAKTG